MPARRRRNVLPFVLAATAVVLMVGPQAIPRTVRTTLALVFVPLRSTAWGLCGLVQRAAPDASADVLEKERDYFRVQAQEMHVKLSEARARLDELSGLRGVLPDPRLRLLPAAVIVGADGSVWRRTIAVARGSAHGVQPGQLVLWERHVLGRVVETGPWSCRVQLLSDPAFKVGAVIVPRQHEGAERREVGVFEGASGQGGVLKWLSGDAAVEEGALVATTVDPERGIPAGLILGRVAGPSRHRGPYPRIEVQSIVNPRAVENVWILLGAQS
ncbi:MAG: rod shape-determining protein MreC [Planctomycetes bacterium]|nr:rod shape-determining protein MreC [Planctomycetota bacterium]